MDDPKPESSDKNQQDVPSDLLSSRPYDDKQPETYVTPTGEPTTIEPITTPLSLQKPKSHSGRWLFRGIVVLLIAVLGAFGYWQWTEAQSASNERASLQAELETVKKAHGEATGADEVDNEIDSASSATTIDPVQAVQSYYDTSEGLVVTKDANEPLRSDFKLVKTSGNFAQVSFKNPLNNNTDTAILKKDSSGVWKVIADSVIIDDTDDNSTNDSSYIYKRYGVPADYQLKAQ